MRKKLEIPSGAAVPAPEVLSPEQLRIQNFARQWKAAHPGKRADEYWDQVALDFAASELERLCASRGPMTAQQFYHDVWLKEHMDDVSDDWPIRFADALSAHNTAALQKDLDADLRDWKKLAEELGCDPTREAMSKRVAELRAASKQDEIRLRSQGAGQWLRKFEIELRTAKFIREEFPIPTGLPAEIYPQIMAILVKHAGLASPPENVSRDTFKCLKCAEIKLGPGNCPRCGGTMYNISPER